MPARPERAALRDRYDRRRAEVVLDAARVFAARGYDQTSVPQLASELGLAAGSLYHYFGGKEQLLIAICNEIMDPLLERAAELEASGLPPVEHLRALARIWVAHVIAHRDHMLVFQQERHVIDHGDQWRQVRADRKRFETLADAALADVERAGAARFDDRRLALSALLGMVNHTAQWYRPRGRLSPEAIADGYTDLLVAAA
ncbi:MAG TPA: TetR/AcrR family transcriptional regulator [Baekduia sp.]|uniref:TetR/AcrR family transcriptional regulator n=1 Tax=Baekduia sp. TaxID=2600305 RepID=UPI002D79953A|nr:TetR/AcrR family transcriptional regulator [Baekduia sp.]HET6508112.1 TetR/AcrR family transcriptional regulator [Baekduia sp.]